MAIIKTTFTPAEAERITGVETALQRRWRKEGHLPKADGGWTRFGPVDLCRLALLGRLSKLIGPAAAAQIMEGQQGQNVAVLTYFQVAVQPGASPGVHVEPTGYRYARSDGKRPFAFSKTQAEIALGGVDIVIDMKLIGEEIFKAIGGPIQREDGVEGEGA